MCKKEYSRISLLCKLKYVGMSTQDLLKTFLSFLLEYACVVWHSKLTVNQTCALERMQKTCLRVILGREYWEYMSLHLKCITLKHLKFVEKTLSIVWEKCLSSSNHRSLFPRNISLHNYNLREQNLFTVVQARTEKLRRSIWQYQYDKGIEFLTQTQILLYLYLYNLMLETFDISNLDYLI